MEFVTLDVSHAQADKKPTVIMPIGDIQYQGKRGPTALDLLKRRIDVGLELGAYFLGMGDYIDFMSPSNRQKRLSAGFYDAAEDVIDDAGEHLTTELYENHLKATTGRWIGLLEGHHFTQFQSGETSDMMLARMLKTNFLGTSCFGRINFSFGKVPQGSVTFWAHHGCGGGAKAAAPVYKLETIANYFDADLFFMGHMTKQAASPMQRVYPSWNGGTPHLSHRKIMLVGTGGFAKGYVERSRQGQVHRGGYVEKGMMSPACLGCPVVRIHPIVKSVKGLGDKTQRLFEPDITAEL